jgi:hypothetical protein
MNELINASITGSIYAVLNNGKELGAVVRIPHMENGKVSALWRAERKVNGKREFLGSALTAEEAAELFN